MRLRSSRFFSKINTLLLVTAALIAVPGHAQNSHQPEPAPLSPPIAAPVDKPYPGTIDLLVDATDVQRRIVSVSEKIPVTHGELTLLYPKWIPGNHSPTGPISKLAGLVITANGNKLPWVRDRVDVYAFHITIPEGVSSLDVQFQFLPPLRKAEGRISFSSKIFDLAWNTVVLYPAGHFSRDITLAPSVKLPAGWQFATALETAPPSSDSNQVHFQPTTLNTLIDSPLYAGANYKRIDLSTSPQNPVYLDLFADAPANLAITPQQIELHRQLAREAQKLYASHHYKHYDFLFLLSDTVGGIGLEHHQSSEDGSPANHFTSWDAGVSGRDLLAHEYTHSWDGKFRRPADLWTPNFNVPMQDDLLWVYEGMTQYFGYVLTARSGLRTPEQTRDLIARIASNFEASPGRVWRPLVDTTNQPTMSLRSPVSWVSWQRPEDYYTEGLLIWLDADSKIRELSGDKKSLDDFARLFYGIEDGSFITHTYSLKDLVTALNTVQPYDWSGFLQRRVYDVAEPVPEEGITHGGYRLVYDDKPIEWMKHEQRPDAATSFSTSIGISVKNDGMLENVWWNSPAFKAGVTPDMQLTAVNGVAFTAEVLRTAILDAEKSTAPLKLLVKRDGEFSTIDLDYHAGLRYPKLERVEGTPARLDAILSAAK